MRNSSKTKVYSLIADTAVFLNVSPWTFLSIHKVMHLKTPAVYCAKLRLSSKKNSVLLNEKNINLWNLMNHKKVI